MISCIMPTRGRRQLAQQALESFNSQIYADKELIIVDDADQPSFPYGVAQDNVKYYCTDIIMPIPEKRNFCCQLSNGEWIAHFDSDDWSAPSRLSTQMALISGNVESVVGFHTMMFWDSVNQKAYRYFGAYFGNYALGTSLLYMRRWWKENEWPNTRTGLASDNAFVKTARKANQLLSFDAGLNMVARIHPGNSSNKTEHKPPYREVDPAELPADFPR